MPLPKPTSNEQRQDFIERCLADAESNAEYPDDAQRFAFCDARYNTSTRKDFDGITKADMPRTLYISRPVVNADEIIAWAKKQGFKSAYQAQDMHCTVAFSRRPLDWFALPDGPRTIRIPGGGPRAVQELGDDGAVVLRFNSDALLRRFEEIMNHGASWDWPSYKPHITFTLDAGDVDLAKVTAYSGDIILGLERYTEIQSNWAENITEKFEMQGEILKADADQRIAWGWFSVIEEGGKAVVDHHGDIIKEQTLVDAAHNFILESRAGKVMHQGRRVADVVESVVFTNDVQKALGIDLGKVGWFAAMKFRDEKVWQDVKTGKLPMFSVGGLARRTAIKM